MRPAAGGPISEAVTLRRLLPLLTLIALMLAPFGRVGMAEATMPAHGMAAGHEMAAMPSHCADMPAPSDDAPADRMIDCLVACAVVTPPTAPAVPIVAPQANAPAAGLASTFVGISPGSDPPPPRLS